MERLLTALSHRLRRYALLVRSVPARFARHPAGSFASRQRRYFQSRMRVLHRPALRYEITGITRLDRATADAGRCEAERDAVWELRLVGPRGVHHAAGDTLLLRWLNPPHLVDEVVGILRCDDTRRYPIVTHSSVFQPGRLRYVRLRRALEEDVELHVAGPRLLDRLGYGAAPHGAGIGLLAPQHVGDGRGVALPSTLRNATPPVDPRELLRLQPRTTARAYSISRVERGADRPGRDTVEIIVSAVETKIKEPDGPITSTDGRATAFVRRLCRSAPPHNARAWRLRHPWRVDTVPGDRLIVIVAGTGIAGALAWLRDRAHHDSGDARKKVWLLFGVRTWDRHGLYQAELLDYRRDSVIDEMDIAQSRSTTVEPSIEAVGARLHHRARVTDVLSEKREMFSQWLESGAALYVSGSRAVGSAVRHEIITAMVDAALASDQTEAQRLLTGWETDGRAQFSVS